MIKLIFAVIAAFLVGVAVTFTALGLMSKYVVLCSFIFPRVQP